MCLEFSKINNGILDYIYKQYSKSIPHIGKIIVGSEKPYKYLIDSIDKFYNQKYNGRKLIWNHHHSYAEIHTNYLKKKYIILVSLPQYNIFSRFNYEDKLMLLRNLWRIAYADGYLDKYEEHLIRKISDLIHVSHSDFINIKLEIKKS